MINLKIKGLSWIVLLPSLMVVLNPERRVLDRWSAQHGTALERRPRRHTNLWREILAGQEHVNPRPARVVRSPSARRF